MKTVTCCGRPLECPGFTNTCPICGADYNWAGQRLAPREQWGEETGESAAEILAVDTMTADELLDGDRGDEPVEFTETREGYRARERWARWYDQLNGAPEGDWDR